MWGGPWVCRDPTAACRKDPSKTRQMLKGSWDYVGSPHWNRLLARPMAPWKEELVLEQGPDGPVERGVHTGAGLPTGPVTLLGINTGTTCS